MDKNIGQISPKHAISSKKIIFFLGNGSSLLPMPIPSGHEFPIITFYPRACSSVPKPTGSAPEASNHKRAVTQGGTLW